MCPLYNPQNDKTKYIISMFEKVNDTRIYKRTQNTIISFRTFIKQNYFYKRKKN